jgi:hypothetical protein
MIYRRVPRFSIAQKKRGSDCEAIGQRGYVSISEVRDLFHLRHHRARCQEFFCERGLAVRSRACECHCAPLNCGDVPVCIGPCVLVASVPPTAR